MSETSTQPRGRVNDVVGMYRTIPATQYDSWERFVNDKCRGLNGSHHSFCNVLAACANASEVSPTPWVTPVIGPGAIADHDELESMLLTVSRATISVTDEPGRALTADFVKSLLHDRLGIDLLVIPAGDSAALEAVDQRLGALLHAAARLGRAFHAIKAQGTPVAGHRDEETATLPAGAVARFEIDEEFLEPARRAIRAATEHWPESADGQDRKVRRVLEESLGRLAAPDQPAQVVYRDVRALTELCWAALVASYYRGWTDLLWGLFMHGQHFPPTASAQGPRPLVDAKGIAADKVSEWLLDRTRSIRPSDRAGDQDPTPPSLHDLVAKMLATQAAFIRESGTEDARRPPMASAFVTGFDVELEKSLLRLEPGSPFVIAVPFELTVMGRPEWNRIVWLGCCVEPSGDIEDLLNPDPDRWFELTAVRASDRLPVEIRTEGSIREEQSQPPLLGSVPCVVRLTGAPLISKPELDHSPALMRGILRLLEPALKRDEEPPGSQELKLEHAVLVDETMALSHTAALLDGGQSTVRQRGVPGYGLPPDLLTSRGSLGLVRFWLLLGVQLADAAVRHTITMQLGMRSSRTARNTLVPLSNGLAINERLTGEAEEALTRLGVDLLRGSVGPIGAELEHYTQHLQSAVDDGTSRLAGSGTLDARFPESPVEERCGLRFER